MLNRGNAVEPTRTILNLSRFSVCHSRQPRRSVGSYDGRPHTTVTSCCVHSASATVCAIFAVAEVSGGKYKLSSSIFMPLVQLVFVSDRGSRFRDQEIPKHQCIHLCPQKTINRLFWLAHNRLVVIKRSVQHRRHSCLSFHFLDQFPVPRIRRLRNGLQPSRSVHVSWRRNFIPFVWLHRVRHRHERRRMRFLKPFAAGFRQNRWREWPENLPVLDPLVQDLFHLGPPRIGHNAPVAQSAWSPLRTSLEPSKNFPLTNNCRGSLHKFRFFQLRHRISAFGELCGFNRLPRFINRKSRSPVSVFHDERPRFPEDLMPHVKRRANRQSCISRRRVHVDILKRRLAQYLSIRHAIERHAARQAYGLHLRLSRQMAQHPQIHFFESCLQRARQIFMPLPDRLFRSPRRPQVLRQLVRK